MSDEPNRFIVVRMVAVLDDAIPEDGEPDVDDTELSTALSEIAARLKVELPGVFVDVMTEYEMFEQAFPCPEPSVFAEVACGLATTLVEGFHRPDYRRCEEDHESPVAAEVTA